MTHDITVEGVNRNNPFKANAVKWSRSIEQISDSASVKVPALTRLRHEGDTYENVATGLIFKEGMKVTVAAGYDGENEIRFKGFIRRINYTLPLEIECEGYSYPLRKKLDFTKHYKNTTVRKILADVVAGTDIVLSTSIPEIPIEKVVFENVTGIQVLEWLKEKCLLTVYFNFNELYCGMEQLDPKASASFRLGWNVVKDNELKFNDQKEFADVRIQVGARKKNGQRENAFSGKKDGQVKKLRSAIKDKATLDRIAEQKRNELVNRGYEGSITAFLNPFVEPGMAIDITDAKYPERTGKYFVSGVDGDFSRSGGRQKIKIGNTL
jgi:hypothetical protein